MPRSRTNSAIDDISSGLAETTITEPQPRNTTRVRSSRINDPPIFHGDPSRTNPFITHVKMSIFADKSRFPTEISKICFMCSFLDGYAFDWATPYLDNLGTNELDTCMTSFNLFLDEFRKSFGEIDDLLGNQSKLLRLRQGRTSAAEYAATFRRLAILSGYEDAALKGIFREGLCDEIKDELATRDLPTDLSSFIGKVVELDNRIRERRGARRYPVYRGNQFVPRHFESKESDVQPMDLDATRIRKYAPLTNQEKERRRRLGLCLYCGAEGHTAYYCEKKGKGRTQGL